MGNRAVPRSVVLVGPLLLLGAGSLSAQVDSCYESPDDAADDVSIVNRFIEAVREGDETRLAEIIDFPLRRRYPLPYLSRSEFIARYDEILDDEFTRIIVSSNENDCGRIGWRGLQLHRGLVWFDEEGHVRTLNYESEFEKGERIRLIDLERSELHESLRKYNAPVLEWETCTYRIRIDSKVNDDYSLRYRYASWKVDRLHNSEPDIIIDNGSRNWDGSGGNHDYYFERGEYKYFLDVEVIGRSSSLPAGAGINGATLSVYRTNQVLLREPILNTGTESRYQALLNRLRECSG